MLINGQPATRIAISDRGLAYGDGLFETIRISNGRLVFADLHLQRLQRGCERLGLTLDIAELQHEMALVLEAASAPDGILKLIVTRGAGGRGYRPPASQTPCRIITLHPLPDHHQQASEGIRAFVCRQRLAGQPSLAGIKHLNRLEQVLASREWPDDSFHEGLMLDTQGCVVEGTRSNIFFASKGVLHTPDLGRCGIDGIMRQVLLRHFGARATCGNYDLTHLHTAEEVFFCNSVMGVWPLLALTSSTELYHWPCGPFADEAARVFAGALQT